MPIYEYACQECDSKFDALRQMTEADAPIECTNCHSGVTHRILSLFNAQSGGKVITGNNNQSCTSCSAQSCASCGH